MMFDNTLSSQLKGDWLELKLLQDQTGTGADGRASEPRQGVGA